MRTLLVSVALAVAMVSTGVWASGKRGPEVVVFGDSLSDTGNRFFDTGVAVWPPYDLLDDSLIPPGPYVLGGFHFSNGATWIERLAFRWRRLVNARPALGLFRRASNYAYGGAAAGRRLEDNANKHLSEQVTLYLADVNHHVSADVLHVLFIGGNDVGDAVRALLLDETGGTSVGLLGESLAIFAANIDALVNAGARNFLILNVPNVGYAPALNPPLAPPNLLGIATCWTLLFNQGTPLPAGCPQDLPPIPGLDDIVLGLSQHPEVTVHTFDVFGLFEQIMMNPEAFGFTDTTNPCVMPNEPPFRCRHPNDYVFWDGFHPTKAVHRRIAIEVDEMFGGLD